jgi:hypothetical protein
LGDFLNFGIDVFWAKKRNSAMERSLVLPDISGSRGRKGLKKCSIAATPKS